MYSAYFKEVKEKSYACLATAYLRVYILIASYNTHIKVQRPFIICIQRDSK